MKFVDEVIITVEGGKGGDGHVGFRREKYIPFGGPNGGDGGDGGSIFLEAKENLNTLANFRYKNYFKAQNGKSGKTNNCTGQGGDILMIPVPLGTLVFEHETETLITELTAAETRFLIAQGGKHGLGNTHFKTSTNRAPRECTPGTLGEKKILKLELKLLADVGLLGLPNAGKSTFIRAISAAKPKVADYPFTTLHPYLGVATPVPFKSFVVADIPGIIAGASEGIGLGLQFLKHLERTRLLLHLVDISPSAEVDPVTAIRIIEQELEAYGHALTSRPRWLIFNKVDLLPEPEKTLKYTEIIREINWTGPVFQISALAHFNTQPLCVTIQQALC